MVLSANWILKMFGRRSKSSIQLQSILADDDDEDEQDSVVSCFISFSQSHKSNKFPSSYEQE